MSKLKKNESVKTIMTVNPLTVNEKTKISEAAALITKEGLHHLPVVSGERLIGMFTRTDLMRIDFSDSFGQDSRQSLATLDSSKNLLDVCVTEVITLSEKDTVQDAAKKFVTGAFHAMPVVDSDQRLRGLVTTTDMIRFYADLD